MFKTCSNIDDATQSLPFQIEVFGHLRTITNIHGREWLQNGYNFDFLDKYTLQKLLTHKSPQMTQRYAHLRDEALKKATELAGDIIEEASGRNEDKRND